LAGGLASLHPGYHQIKNDDVEIVIFRDERQRLRSIIRLHLIKKGDKAPSVDGMIIDDQNFHGFVLSARSSALRK
jgi:hypothetical protein